MAKQNGWLVTEDFSRYDGNRESVVSYPWLSKEEADREFKKAKYIISEINFTTFKEYLKNVYDSKGLSGLSSFIVRKTPGYSMRLLRKQFFKLKTRIT